MHTLPKILMPKLSALELVTQLSLFQTSLLLPCQRYHFSVIVILIYFIGVISKCSSSITIFCLWKLAELGVFTVLLYGCVCVNSLPEGGCKVRFVSSGLVVSPYLVFVSMEFTVQLSSSCVTRFIQIGEKGKVLLD